MIVSHELQRFIGECIGEASMCWQNPAGAGEFDSVQASIIIDKIMERLHEE